MGVSYMNYNSNVYTSIKSYLYILHLDVNVTILGQDTENIGKPRLETATWLHKKRCYCSSGLVGFFIHILLRRGGRGRGGEGSNSKCIDVSKYVYLRMRERMCVWVVVMRICGGAIQAWVRINKWISSMYECNIVMGLLLFWFGERMIAGDL